MTRDLEEECWKVYDAVDKPAEKLKALDLLVTIRCAGPKVKGASSEGGSDGARSKMRDEVLNDIKNKAGK